MMEYDPDELEIDVENEDGNEDFSSTVRASRALADYADDEQYHKVTKIPGDGTKYFPDMQIEDSWAENEKMSTVKFDVVDSASHAYENYRRELAEGRLPTEIKKLLHSQTAKTADQFVSVLNKLLARDGSSYQFSFGREGELQFGPRAGVSKDIRNEPVKEANNNETADEKTVLKKEAAAQANSEKGDDQVKNGRRIEEKASRYHTDQIFTKPGDNGMHYAVSQIGNIMAGADSLVLLQPNGDKISVHADGTMMYANANGKFAKLDPIHQSSELDGSANHYRFADGTRVSFLTKRGEAGIQLQLPDGCKIETSSSKPYQVDVSYPVSRTKVVKK